MDNVDTLDSVDTVDNIDTEDTVANGDYRLQITELQINIVDILILDTAWTLYTVNM